MTASRSATTQSAYASTDRRPGPAVPPCPGRSIARTRTRSAKPSSWALHSSPLPPAPWTRTRGRPDPASRQWVSRPWTTGIIRDLQQGGEPTSLALLDPPGHRGEGRTAGRPGLQDGAAGGDGPERLDPIPADGHVPVVEVDRGIAVARDQPQPVADAER